MRMVCATVQGLIQRHLDGEVLDTREQGLVAAHLVTCADCRAFRQDVELIIGVVERLPVEPVPQGFVSSVMESIPAARGRVQSPPVWSDRLARLWAPIAALIGMAILLAQTASVHGVSLLNLPSAIVEWTEIVDWSNLESMISATSLLALSLDAGFLLGISLLVVAIFAMIVQILASSPSSGVAARR